MKQDYDLNHYYLQQGNNLEAAQEDIPTTLLPNMGEGGAVYPGDTGNQGNIPTTLLPNVGEGGAVYPGNDMPGMNRPGSVVGQGGIIGGAVVLPSVGTIISTHPRPSEPCRFCKPNVTRRGILRILNATTGYDPFVVYVNENVFSESLSSAEITDYAYVPMGRVVITIAGENGYTFIQQQIDVRMNAIMTIAIVNTNSGLALEVIIDQGCDRGTNVSCIRAANLAYHTGTISVTIGNQRVNFPNLSYRSVSNFEQLFPGLYIYTVTNNMMARMPGNSNILVAAPLQIHRNRNYTIYVLSTSANMPNRIRVLIVEDIA